MNIILVFAVVSSECLLFSVQFSLAAPALQASEDPDAVSFDVKRDAEYRNSLFGAYICRVMKATDAVQAKLLVSN